MPRLRRTASIVSACSGAFLFFWLQLLIAKLVLPILGGVPAVWLTCLVFFQLALLAGHAYAHLGTSLLGFRLQAGLHVLLLLLVFLFLPMGVPPGWAGPGDAPPALWLSGLLIASVGVVSLVLAATSPLIQAWLARSGSDPYPLYSASNAGSFGALVAFPLVLERHVGTSAQCIAWSAGYVLYAVSTCVALLLARRGDEAAPPAADASSRGTPFRFLPPILLAFASTSLLTGISAVLTTDIASAPLMWVLPLGLYLLSYALAFRHREAGRARHWLVTAIVIDVLLFTYLPFSLVRLGPAAGWGLLAVQVAGFYVVVAAIHGRIARRRPDPRDLTRFYLSLALGGLLGGAWTAFAAPMLFSSLVEYPMALVIAGLALAATAERRAGSRSVRLVRALSAGILIGTLAMGFSARFLVANLPGLVAAATLLAALALALGAERWRVGLAAVTIVLIAQFSTAPLSTIVFRERTFYGVHRVVRNLGRGHQTLLHGTTVHGRQSLDPALRREPLTYFGRTGPVGEALAELQAGARFRRIALVGLGAGSMLAYAEEGQAWDVYELDPSVARIAGDRSLFTFLADARGRVDVALGDARLGLGRRPGDAYDLIVLDAFSSDALPTHLMTSEAFLLYADKLAPDGVIVMNVSNRFLELEAVVANSAGATGLHGLACRHVDLDATEVQLGMTPSHWIVLAEDEAVLAPLAAKARWHRLQRSSRRAWTDDFSDITAALTWDPGAMSRRP
jgi:hypothetical protein